MAFLKEVYPEQSRFYNDTTIGEKDGDQNESLETRNRINIQYINDIKLTKNKYDTLDEESLREMKVYSKGWKEANIIMKRRQQFKISY